MPGVYDAAEAYAVAFSYRNIACEVDALIGWAEPAMGHPVHSVLELAAGPADHAREFAQRGIRATALDLSPAMTDFARVKAAEAGVPLQVVTADMRDFALRTRFDLAITMIDSLAHLTDEASLDAHLVAVARHLGERGGYIVEFSHPDDALDDDALTETRWTQAAGDAAVTISWGAPGDVTDPVTGVTMVNVTVEYRRDGHSPLAIHEVVPQRAWRPEDITAALRRTDVFEPVGWYGSFAGIALDDPKAWRMIVVLQRVS